MYPFLGTREKKVDPIIIENDILYHGSLISITLKIIEVLKKLCRCVVILIYGYELLFYRNILASINALKQVSRKFSKYQLWNGLEVVLRIIFSEYLV